MPAYCVFMDEQPGELVGALIRGIDGWVMCRQRKPRLQQTVHNGCLLVDKLIHPLPLSMSTKNIYLFNNQFFMQWFSVLVFILFWPIHMRVCASEALEFKKSIYDKWCHYPWIYIIHTLKLREICNSISLKEDPVCLPGRGFTILYNNYYYHMTSGGDNAVRHCSISTSPFWLLIWQHFH